MMFYMIMQGCSVLPLVCKLVQINRNKSLFFALSLFILVVLAIFYFVVYLHKRYVIFMSPFVGFNYFQFYEKVEGISDLAKHASVRCDFGYCN